MNSYESMGDLISDLGFKMQEPGAEYGEVRRLIAWGIFILSGALVFARFGPASVEINRGIYVLASPACFLLGCLQAKNNDLFCLLAFALSASALVLAFSLL